MRRSPLLLIARNAPLVLVGEALPLVAAVVALPVLSARMGVDRLGVLSLAWVVIGYFSLFDLGIGRATTQLIAARLAAGERGRIPALVATSLGLLLALGCAGGAALAAIAPWLAGRALSVPPSLADETTAAFRLLALTLPFALLTSGLRGVLEAERRFAAAAAIRASLGLMSFLGPLAVLPYSDRLTAVVFVLAASRVVILIAAAVLCRHVLSWRGTAQGFDRELARALATTGGWYAVSNAVGPLLVLLDRFAVGALVSVGAVAFYATPLEIVQRAGLVPVAICTVMFPAMAASARTDPEQARELLATSARLCVLAVFPILLGFALWSHDALRLWLGSQFASESTVVVRWVVPGLLLNAVGCAAIFALQAVGRADLPAKLHVLELAGYVPLLWWLTAMWGIEGAAIAWCTRVGVDAILLGAAAQLRFKLDAGSVIRLLALVAFGLVCLAAASRG